jgi:hypothetical protein
MYEDQTPQATVPADVDTPDQIAWGLTFRQLAIIATAAGAGWLAYSSLGPLLPPVVWLVAAVPLAGLTVVVALGRRDGLALDVWLRHGLALRSTTAVQAPGRPRAGSPLVATTGDTVVPAPLRSPLTGIAADGTLSVEGTGRRLIACGTTNVALRTGQEQAALLDGFGRWLHGLAGPAQIVVAAHRHDLTPYATTVAQAAARLPHPALQTAAADYAGFLLELDTTRDPLRRQVLAVVAAGPAGQATARALAAFGVTAQLLDGGAVTAALAAAADPYELPAAGPRAVPGIPVTATGRTS